MTIFRGFRIIRIFKLVNVWENLSLLLAVIGRTVQDVSNFTVLLFVITFTYTLFGLELFAHKIKFNEEGRVDLKNGESPRMNFDSFYEATMSVFVILQGENWQYILYDQ
jgi:voltage-gated sodium channel type IV alpha